MDLIDSRQRNDFSESFSAGLWPAGNQRACYCQVVRRRLGWRGREDLSLESAKVVNVVPRYGKLRSKTSGEVIGFENIELISDRPIDVWLEEFRQIKKDYPKHILIASIMEEYEKTAGRN